MEFQDDPYVHGLELKRPDFYIVIMPEVMPGGKIYNVVIPRGQVQATQASVAG